MKILVLGHTGMLGNCVYKYLSMYYEVITLDTNLRWPTEEFKKELLNKNCDLIINCIGAIPQRSKNFKINKELPEWIDKNISSNIKVIHPGTDCESDMDDYGISKRKAFDYIVRTSSRTKIIKTSIIGHETKNFVSLLEWFLRQEREVNGFSNHYWNGITTLEWSKVCKKIIDDWSSFKTVTVVGSNCITKLELLNKIKEVYKKEITVKSFEHEEKHNKCLNYCLFSGDIKDQIIELKEFYEK